MLGRMRMSIDACIRSYLGIIDEVFSVPKSRPNLIGPKYSSRRLEEAVKRIVKEQTGHYDTVFRRLEEHTSAHPRCST